jgi:hypothetical protein
LHRVLGIASIAEHAVGDGEEPWRMVSDQRIK